MKEIVNELGLICLLLVGCGNSGSFISNPTYPFLPIVPTGTITHTILVASRTSTTTNPATVLVSQTGNITLPALSDFTVDQNIPEFWHVSLQVAGVTCDYIHQAGAVGISSGAGCSTLNTEVSVKAGDQIVLSINNTVINNSAVEVTLKVQN